MLVGVRSILSVGIFCLPLMIAFDFCHCKRLNQSVSTVLERVLISVVTEIS